MEIYRGDIFWADPNPERPTFGSVQSAGRPCIIVSNDQNNTYSSTVEIVYLTTAPKNDLPTHCPINGTGRPSTAICEQITTISKSQLGKFVGTCTNEEMAALERCILASLGMNQYDEDATEEYDEEDVNETTTNQATTNQATTNQETYNGDLYKQLIEAKQEAKLMRELYNDLLSRTIK